MHYTIKITVMFQVFASQVQTYGTVFADASMTSASNGNAMHPFLYFSSTNVENLRKKAETTHEKISREIKRAGIDLVKNPESHLPPTDYKEFAKNWNERFGNRLSAFALYCLLYPGDTKVLEVVKTYMDRMANYPDWYVTASHGIDQVPVGHSLTGFATAYDFVYQFLEPDRRKRYRKAIENVTMHMYDVLVKRRDWPMQYIHNHAPSNLVATLLGAMVISADDPNTAAPWIKRARLHMDRAMQILALITDGSMDEGVSYGTYTSRGVTQYVYLAKRHFQTDHTKNPWLREYFWSLYKTLLPGFQNTVGIADSKYNWFYGPESQLVFLDAFVLKNGYGNWLADKIRAARIMPSNVGAQGWSTVHTEFIFYNASLLPREPPESKSKMYAFPDWGLVTYGGGQELAVGNTFLSFKSGALNGEAVREIMTEKLFSNFVDGWKNFNPGHEHPDQNSFIFAPNGKPVVTESYYGPKVSYLDNVIVFAPSKTSKCNQPWEGQLGECDKWLNYKEYTRDNAGEIIAAVAVEEMVFIAGESVAVYSDTLGISSVYRGVLLLNPEVLVVVDTIRLRQDSTTKVASALFHNVNRKFKKHRAFEYEGGVVEHDDGNYSFFSMVQGSKPLNVSISNGIQPDGLREGPTNYVNVTFALKGDTTNVVHIFSGPRTTITSASFLSSPESSGIKLSLGINGVQHIISVASRVRSNEKAVVPWKERRKITGFDGFARVEKGSEQILFGSKKRTHQLLHKNGRNKSNFKQVKGAEETNLLVSRQHQRERMSLQRISLLSGFTFLSSLLLLFCVITRRWHLLKLNFRYNTTVTIFGMIACVVLLLINSVCIDVNGKNVCFGQRKLERVAPEPPSRGPEQKPAPASNFNSPFVLITSLPGCGSELLSSLFNESGEFLYLDIASAHGVKIPFHGANTALPDLCQWGTLDSELYSLPLGWFHTLRTRPVLFFNNVEEKDQFRWIKRHLRQNRNTGIALNLRTGFWTSKAQWIKSAVGGDSFHSILVVRDPRSWVYSILKEARALKMRNSLIDAYKDANLRCGFFQGLPPKLTKYVAKLQPKRTTLEPIEQLTAVWTLSTALGIFQWEEVSENSFQDVVRIEDLIERPSEEAADIFGHLAIPLSVRRISKLQRYVKSGYFTLPHFGMLGVDALDDWKSGLTTSDIERVEAIASPLMKELGYEPASLT